MSKSSDPPLRIRLPHAAISRKTDFLLAGFFACIHVLLTTVVYHYVPGPYMDEVFHITQTQSYCIGNYTWNPLITTPPALYVLSMPFCGGFERYANSILFFFMVPALCRFRRMIDRNDVYLTVSIVSSLPILMSTQILFYTDLLSLTTVMWGFSVSSPSLSALFFLIACLTRQTNIIWAAIYACSLLLSQLDLHVDVKSKSRNSKIWKNVKTLISTSIFELWPFLMLASGFLVFFYWNNFQIVLGDAKAHHPKFHVAQWLYFLLFSAAHAWPMLVMKVLKMQLFNFRGFILQVIIAFLLWNFAYDHEYLLADNRHYTFYIWRRILSKPIVRISFAPIFWIAGEFMIGSTSRISWIHQAIFTVATLLVLVPAHLFEMRYYIIPYVIWRLATSSEPSRRKCLLLIELFSQILIFAGVFWIFLFKTFEWENEPGVKQRIMF